jgi:hypothetical protein
VATEDSCVKNVIDRIRYWRQYLARASAIALAVFAAATSGRGVAAQITWLDTRQIEPFVIQATFPLAEYDGLFLELPELQQEISRTLGVPPARTPINIFLFADAEQYRSYTERHFPKVPYRPALFIWDGGSPAVYTYRKPDLHVDLRHECTHALLHSVLPVVPLWLDEGLAKYFEVPNKQRASGHPYFDDLKWKWSLRLGMVRTIESLEQRQNLTEMDAADYRYSWAWVHFMLHGPEPAHQALVNYLTCYQQSVPAGKLSVRLAEAVPNPTGHMIQHFKNWRE